MVCIYYKHTLNRYAKIVFLPFLKNKTKEKTIYNFPKQNLYVLLFFGKKHKIWK